MITVRHEHDDHFHIDIRHHGLVVDQPKDDGGDLGPTPVELFVASLAACAAHYARRFLERHDITTEGFAVNCDYDMSGMRPARVAAVAIDVTLPATFPLELREPLMRVIDHCTVKNSIMQAPAITVEVQVEKKVA
jgi:putative redox protein